MPLHILIPDSSPLPILISNLGQSSSIVFLILELRASSVQKVVTSRPSSSEDRHSVSTKDLTYNYRQISLKVALVTISTGLYHHISKNYCCTDKVCNMHKFKRLLVFLATSVQLVMSTPLDTPTLFRRQCPGDALTVLEGSSCDMSQADALACSDNCFDIVSHRHSRASNQPTVFSFNVLNNLPIQIRG